MKKIRISLLVCGALALLHYPTVQAAPLDNRIPNDALLYVGWQGADALAPAYANSNMKAIFDNSTLPAFITQQMPKWLDMAGQKDSNAPAEIEDAKTALNVLWHHAVAIYVGPVDMANPQEPKPRFAMLCDAGADSASLIGVIQKSLDKAGPSPVNVGVVQKDGVVMLTVGVVSADNFAVHAGALNTAPAYVQAMKHVRPNGAMTAYGDVHGFFGMIDGIIQAAVAQDKGIPADARQKYETIVEGLGLRTITQFAASSGFDGKGWRDDAFIGAPGPRTGLVALADQGAISPDVLAAVPQNAVQCGASKFDFTKLMTLARDIVGRIDPAATDKMEQSLGMANLVAGFDVEKDLINTLGDEWVFFRFPSPDGIGLANGFTHKLKDAATFSKTLTSIEALINARAGASMQVEPADADGIPVSSVQTPVFSVAWTVRNGYFYISSLPGISAVVNQVEKHLPSITENASFKTAVASLPKVKANSISFSDPAKIYPEIYRAASTALPLLRAAGIAVPLSILPTPAKATPFMTPAAGESWSDAEGFHFLNKG